MIMSDKSEHNPKYISVDDACDVMTRAQFAMGEIERALRVLNLVDATYTVAPNSKGYQLNITHGQTKQTRVCPLPHLSAHSGSIYTAIVMTVTENGGFMQLPILTTSREVTLPAHPSPED